MKKWLPLILVFAFSTLAHGQGFEVGFARRVITPPLDSGRPVYIAGFGHNRLATGVHDELFARCIAVTFQARSIALVSVDLIGLSLEDTEAIRHQVRPQKPAAQRRERWPSSWAGWSNISTLCVHGTENQITGDESHSEDFGAH